VYQNNVDVADRCMKCGIFKVCYSDGYDKVFLRFIDEYGIKSSVTLFRGNCFSARIGGTEFMEVFLKFVKDFKIEFTVRLFRGGCFAKRIGDTVFLANFIRFIDASDAQTMTRVYTDTVPKNFNVLAEKPDFVTAMLSFIALVKVRFESRFTHNLTLASMILNVKNALSEDTDLVNVLTVLSERVNWMDVANFLRWVPRQIRTLDNEGFFTVFLNNPRLWNEQAVIALLAERKENPAVSFEGFATKLSEKKRKANEMFQAARKILKK